jgi:hypothetical protein
MTISTMAATILVAFVVYEQFATHAVVALDMTCDVSGPPGKQTSVSELSKYGRRYRSTTLLIKDNWRSLKARERSLPIEHRDSTQIAQLKM